MEENLEEAAGENSPTCKKQKTPQEWMDKDMKEFYMVRIGGD